MNVKRYDLGTVYQGSIGTPGIIEQAGGRYVLASDYDVLVGKMEAVGAGGVSLMGARQGWIPTSDRLPEQNIVVFLKDENRWMNTGADGFDPNWHGAGYLSEFGQKYWSVFGEGRGRCLDYVTHWMPIPQPEQQGGV